MSGYKIRDGVLIALIDTYGPPEAHGKDWYGVKYWAEHFDAPFSTELCLQLTTDILAHVAWAYTSNDKRAEYERENLFSNIFQIIWTSFPGGTTAEIAAKKVCDVLGVSYEETV